QRPLVRLSRWVFGLQASQHFHCFRIYRETLSRFSCAAPGTLRISDALAALREHQDSIMGSPDGEH
ncbi:hypothetical protein ABLN72_02815, partial [Mycobacterium tuberculosis]